MGLPNWILKAFILITTVSAQYCNGLDCFLFNSGHFAAMFQNMGVGNVSMTTKPTLPYSELTAYPNNSVTFGFGYPPSTALVRRFG